jgi:hypothetical protein
MKISLNEDLIVPEEAHHQYPKEKTLLLQMMTKTKKKTKKLIFLIGFDSEPQKLETKMILTVFSLRPVLKQDRRINHFQQFSIIMNLPLNLRTLSNF